MPVLEGSSSSPFLTENSPLSVVQENQHVQELGTTETHHVLPDVVMAVTGDGAKAVVLEELHVVDRTNEQINKQNFIPTGVRKVGPFQLRKMFYFYIAKCYWDFISYKSVLCVGWF